MKRLFFIGCMIFMVTNIMAYQSVLVEGRTWSTLWYGGATGIDSIDNRPPTTKLYKVEGDSIINGMTYKKYLVVTNKINSGIYSASCERMLKMLKCGFGMAIQIRKI